MGRLAFAAAILALAAFSDLCTSPAQGGDLFVTDFNGNKVVRFDASTGAFIDTFVPSGSGGLDGPYGLTIGPDGNLYVANGIGATRGGDRVLRYDGVTGEFIDAFIRAESGGLGPQGALVFGADGNLYVPSSPPGGVFRYDGLTGEFIDEFVPSGSGGLSASFGLVFGT